MGIRFYKDDMEISFQSHSFEYRCQNHILFSGQRMSRIICKHAVIKLRGPQKTESIDSLLYCYYTPQHCYNDAQFTLDLLLNSLFHFVYIVLSILPNLIKRYTSNRWYNIQWFRNLNYFFRKKVAYFRFQSQNLSSSIALVI